MSAIAGNPGWGVGIDLMYLVGMGAAPSMEGSLTTNPLAGSPSGRGSCGQRTR